MRGCIIADVAVRPGGPRLDMFGLSLRTTRLPWLLVLAGIPVGCGAGEDAGPVMATPEVTLSRERFPLGAPLDITYRFQMARDAPPIDDDYRVLVHFMDADEELMWTDDHEPPVPTSRWSPGEPLEYTRTMFAPIYPYIGPGTVQVGLYSPETERRLVLEGDDRGQRSYTVATFELLPQSENIFVIYEDGWHPAEIAPDNPVVEWQWTTGMAVLAFRNPEQDATLYLDLDGRPDLFETPQRVSVRIGETVLDEFTLSGDERLLRRIPIEAAEFGNDDMVRVHLAVDQTFIPSERTDAPEGPADSRELGVRVFNVFVEPR